MLNPNFLSNAANKRDSNIQRKFIPNNTEFSVPQSFENYASDSKQKLRRKTERNLDRNIRSRIEYSSRRSVHPVSNQDPIRPQSIFPNDVHSHFYK